VKRQQLLTARYLRAATPLEWLRNEGPGFVVSSYEVRS
jgi:hypothetical protein